MKNKFLKVILSVFKKIFKCNIFDKYEKLVAYICGGEALPQALTQEEEQDLILKLSQGDFVRHQAELIFHSKDC